MLPHAQPPVQWESVFVFLSSTFNDMHAERDYLVKRVFPELRDWCERRKLRLVEIDLRWGVTEQDATLNKNVVKVCLDGIDNCRPFFLCFLGQRRGWVPGSQDLSAETVELFPELTGFVSRSSITELEIVHAVVSPFKRNSDGSRSPAPGSRHEVAKHSFFYLRGPSYLEQLPGEPPLLREIYTNVGRPDADDNDEVLRDWRERRIPQTGRPVRLYDGCWDSQARTPELGLPFKCPAALDAGRRQWREQWCKLGIELPDGSDEVSPELQGQAGERERQLTAGRLTDFRCTTSLNDSPARPPARGRPLGEVIIEDLQAAIRERFPDHREELTDTSFQRELAQHELFLLDQVQGFIERPGTFDDLDRYGRSDSRRPFILTAESGLGKSATLAAWVERCRKMLLAPQETIFCVRFIGAGDGFASVDGLLRSLVSELQDRDLLSGEVLADPLELRRLFPELLQAAGRRTPVVLVLDALNQLESGLGDLSWLPRELPPGVKLVVSVSADAPGAAEWLRDCTSAQAEVHAVPPFGDHSHRRGLVKDYLAQHLKQLDDATVEQLISFSGARNPLFLKVALSELRVFGSFAQLRGQVSEAYGDNPVSAFTGVLSRLENDPAYSPLNPKQAVPLLFGFLAHGRRGLTEAQLTDLLAMYYPWPCSTPILSPGERRQAAHDAVNLYLHQVRPSLSRRNGRYGFFYETFQVAAAWRYAGELPSTAPGSRPARDWHGLLADFFERQDPPGEDALEELPYHLLQASRDERLVRLLTDLRYLGRRSSLCDVYRLIEDYDLVPEVERVSVLPYRDFLRQHAQRLRRHRGLFFTLIQHEGFAEARAKARELADAGGWETPWLRTTEAWVPAPPAEAGSRTRAEILAHRESEGCAVVALAETGALAFWLRRLGRVGVVDLRSGQELAQEVFTRRVAALALSCSADGRHLAIAHEDGQAEVLQLRFGREGALADQRRLTTFPYLVPEVEPPVFEFVEDALWFQSDSRGLMRLPLEGNDVPARATAVEAWPGSGELSGLVCLSRGVAVTLREGRATCLLVLRAENTASSLVLPNVDVLALTRFGPDGVAVAFTNGRVAVFSTAEGLQEVAATTVQDLVFSLGSTGPALLWVTGRGGLYRWEVAAGPRVEQVDTTTPHLRRARRLAALPDGTFAAVSGHSAVRFAITQGGRARTGQLVAVFLDPGGKGYYAVGLRHPGIILVNGVSREEETVEPNTDDPHTFGFDGASYLLGARKQGAGLLADLPRKRARLVEGIPPDVTSVTGRAGGGFWLADLSGGVWFVGPDGRSRPAGSVGLKEVARPLLPCWGDQVVWVGECMHEAESGREVLFAAVFFREVVGHTGELRTLGQRVFAKREGRFGALAPLPGNGRMAFAFNDTLKTGTAHEFIDGRETKHVLADLGGDAVEAVFTPDGSLLYLRTDRGSLHCFDAQTMEPLAVLSGSLPVTGMTSGCAADGSVVLIINQSSLCYCRLERKVST